MTDTTNNQTFTAEPKPWGVYVTMQDNVGTWVHEQDFDNVVAFAKKVEAERNAEIAATSYYRSKVDDLVAERDNLAVDWYKAQQNKKYWQNKYYALEKDTSDTVDEYDALKAKLNDALQRYDCLNQAMDNIIIDKNLIQDIKDVASLLYAQSKYD